MLGVLVWIVVILLICFSVYWVALDYILCSHTTIFNMAIFLLCRFSRKSF